MARQGEKGIVMIYIEDPKERAETKAGYIALLLKGIESIFVFFLLFVQMCFIGVSRDHDAYKI